MTISVEPGESLTQGDFCTSCSNIGGTVTVTVQCKIQGSGDDKECNAANFNATKCDYVVLRNNHFVCDEVKRNYTGIFADADKLVKNCDKVCPASIASGGC